MPYDYKKHYQANKEEAKARTREWNKHNKEKKSAYNKEYGEAHRVHWRDYHNEYQKKRKGNPAVRLMVNLRSRHNKVLRGLHSTTKGLGCDSNFLREHIENQFTEGMSWDNYGYGKDKWNIDHIQPLSLYHTNPELLPKLIHYSNMQPMWQPENQSKADKV